VQPGSRLGHFEIIAPLGAGGMGQVFRARDTRLDRTVAIKVLPDTLAGDPQFRERFDREARAIAALSHPHICTLYDVGEQDGLSFLVMELIEGETLAVRLARGALPLRDALKAAIEIASALDKAHRAGIVHRDFKPGNVMLTKSGAKLLDFGLAKSHAPLVSGSHASILPTTPANLTLQGTILGTLQYMAPEQLEGGEADARTDIFAFGAVLYEMVTGRKAFEAKSHASLIGAIMHAQPEAVARILPLAPAGLDHVVTTCLAKDPDERWQTAGDVARELKWIADDSAAARSVHVDAATAPTPRGRSRATVAWLAAGVSTVLCASTLALALGGYFGRAPATGHVYRASVLPPPDGAFFSSSTTAHLFAMSPDGQRMVFVATGTTRRPLLWVRRLDGLVAQPLEGTDGGVAPFWSPDSRFVAFVAGGKLKKIDALGGPAMTLADGDILSVGAWNRDDVILFAPRRGPLFRVPASGGSPSPVTALDSARNEIAHFYPSFLPDQRHFLYVARSLTRGGPTTSAVFVGSLDGEKPKLLVEGTSNAKYASGHVLFVRERTLMAQPFDVERLALRGDAESIAEQVETAGPIAPIGAFTVSDSGAIAYRTSVGDLRSQLTWFDRSGRPLSTIGEPADQMSLELSPDGTRALVSMLDAGRNSRDLWIYDVARGLRTRFTFDPADEMMGVWSPDGSRIVFNSRRRGGNLDLFEKASSGAGDEELLLTETRNLYPSDWSAHSLQLLYYTGSVNSPTGNDLWSLPLQGAGRAVPADARKPTPVLAADAWERNGRVSSDGRFMLYQSNESGREEVYVTPAGGGGKWQVSIGGGQWPRWRRDGKEIYFLSPDDRVMAAAISGEGAAVQVGTVQALFSARPRMAAFVGSEQYAYDVSPDGQRFLVNTLADQSAAPPITLVVNWTAGLKK